jgi:hypothetical protein
MSFKKAIKSAKAMQQTFDVDMSVGPDIAFTGRFRTLRGEPTVWTLRIDNTEETGVSYGFLLDLRIFCASIVSFTDEDGVALPIQIIQNMFTDGELTNPSRLVNPDRKDIFTETKIFTMWQELSANCKKESDYDNLPLVAKELIWDLLLRGMILTFDREYNMMFLAKFNNELDKLAPNLVVSELERQVDKIRQLTLDNQEKAEIQEAHAEAK